jgi:rod shape-determining protein MreD
VLRLLLIFLSTLLLWVLTAQLNHVLAPWRIYLFLGALAITLPALTSSLRTGLLASFLGGLLFDAVAPIPFGTHALLFSLTHAVIFNLRDRVPRDDTLSRVLIALFANLGLFLLFSFTQVARSPAPASLWPRLFADLACSQLVLALIAPWFFAIQSRALALVTDESAPSRYV